MASRLCLAVLAVLAVVGLSHLIVNSGAEQRRMRAAEFPADERAGWADDA